MSIATAILADAPLVYWKLDDPTGPAASDSSGNNRPGVYGGTFNLGLPGPEAGTLAALFHDDAIVFSVGPTPRLIRPFTLEVWVALEGIQSDQNNVVYNGNGNINGYGLLWSAGQSFSQPVKVIVGGNAIGAPTPTLVQVGGWHDIIVVTDVTQFTTVYLDGVAIYGPANTGPMNAIAATDKFQVGANKNGQLLYVAHAALYGAALTAAQALAHATSAVAPQSPTPVGGITGADVTSMLDLLNKIYASVHKVY